MRGKRGVKEQGPLIGETDSPGNTEVEKSPLACLAPKAGIQYTVAVTFRSL